MGVLTGTPHDDTLTGAWSDDTLDGGPGNDRIDGKGGNDFLNGGIGDDLVIGGAGHDSFSQVGSQGNDTLIGGAESDGFSDVYGSNVMDGGDGMDWFNVVMFEGGGGHTMTGGAGQDRYAISGNSLGNDFVITDFAVGPGERDVLFLDSLLEHGGAHGYSGGNPFNEELGFLRLLQVGDDVLLQWDEDGAAGTFWGWETEVTLKGVNASDLSAENFWGHIPPDGSTPPDLVVNGTSSSEYLRGENSNDWIFGFDGEDGLFGDGGRDRLDGGAGNDNLDGGRGADTLLGGSGDDWFTDRHGANVFDGGGGDDTFYLTTQDPAGTTTIYGGLGRDRYLIDASTRSFDFVAADFTPGAGGDVLDIEGLGLLGYEGGNPFSQGYFRLVESGGGDTELQWDHDGEAGAYGWVSVITLQGVIAAALTADNFSGGIPPDGSAIPGVVKTGTDVQYDEEGVIVVTGKDTLEGGYSDDLLSGLSGNDVLAAKGGGDVLDGGDGADGLDGGAGHDSLVGGHGNDKLAGGDGNDTLEGGEGADAFLDWSGTNIMSGGGGADTFAVGTYGFDYSRNTVSGGDGRDSYNITLDWYAPYDYIVTDFAEGAGGDYIGASYLLERSASFGYTAGNPFDAGLGYLRFFQDGSDTLVQWDIDGAAAGHYDWQTVLTLQNVSADSITVDNLLGELIAGTGKNDSLDGGYGCDTVCGYAGDDTLAGGSGSDTLNGGNGQDLLAWGEGDVVNGGAGSDTLRLKFGDIDLTGRAGARISNVETFKLNGGGDSELTLARKDVLDTSSTDTLRVFGTEGDVVNAQGFKQLSDFRGYHRYKSGAAILLVETDVAVVL